MNYKEFIGNIINSRGREVESGYFEEHHILPKCMGGDNSPDNLIQLTPQEHYMAHKLLALENPDNQGLLLAWNLLSRVDGIEISPDEFAMLREKMSNSLSGEGNPMYGKHHSDESRRKIGDSSKGSKHWNYGNTGDKCVWYGKHHTTETRCKMSKAALGIPKSEQAKIHMRENNTRKIPVICIETKEEFISSNEAGRRLGILGSNINRCCKGKRKSAGGYHWRYKF